MTDKQKTPTQQKADIAQNASIDDKDRKDRPGSANGKLATNADYDYRPDFGATGGAVANDEKVLDGQSVEQTPQPEGDKPADLNKPAEKFTEKSKS